MKIPHRPMFFCQVIATIVAGTVQLGVQAWMFSNIEDLCSANQKDGFICPATTVFGTASIVVSFVVATYLCFPLLNACCLCCSGVSLGHSVCSRTVSSTTASSSSSWPAPLHHCYSGRYTRSSRSISSNTSTSRSCSPARASCLLQPLLTSCPGCSSALSLIMSSVGATLAGGLSIIVSCFMLTLSDGLFSDVRWDLDYFRCVIRWIGCRLCYRYPLYFLCPAIPEEWHDWPERHSSMVG
jgi:OPT oligopeptide transporter protein